MGRPKGSGYISQVKLLQELRSTSELSFTQLVHLTKLHRNTVANNLRILNNRGVVQKRKEGRYALYSITSEDLAWRYIERHTSNLASLFKDPTTRRISKACYDLAVEASKPKLWRYIWELSRYPDSQPYGWNGIKVAKFIRSYRRSEDRRLLQAIRKLRGKPQTETPTRLKAPLRPTHLLYDSALFRLSRGKGNGLDWLIVLLTELTFYKWQNIQHPEISYLRPETQQDEAWISKINVGKSRKDHEESRCRIQEDHERWKLHKEEYIRGLRDPVKDGVRNVIVNSPLTVIDKKGMTVGSISYVQFKAEERNGFVNWREDFGRIQAKKLAQACMEQFRDPPIHFLDYVRERIAHAKIVYAEVIWFVSQRYGNEFNRFADLREVLERINPDISNVEQFRRFLSEEQLGTKPVDHLKALQEVLYPWKISLATDKSDIGAQEDGATYSIFNPEQRAFLSRYQRKLVTI